MDRYIGDIITDQRHDTRNRDTEAHDDDQFLRYNRYAQRHLYGLITRGFSWVFEKTIETAIVANQTDYEVNDNLAYGTRIVNVEYRPSGSTRYYPLTVTPDRYRQLAYVGRPRFFKRRHGTVIIEPAPDTADGFLRITYERALDILALRSASISGTPSGTNITLSSPSTTEEAKYLANTYVCVTDAFGTPLLYNGIISTYGAGTDIISLTGNVEDYLVTGKTLADLDGAYVTLGKYTSTHSGLPNEAELFFNEYVNRKLHNIDDSDQFLTTDKLVQDTIEEIVGSMKMPDKTRKVFPVHDFDMLIPEYE